MQICYEIVYRKSLTDGHRSLFADMLKEQGKVQGDLSAKADRCKLICLAKLNGKTVGIGAIKKKTESDFDENKSGLVHLKDDFEWELGYVFTQKAVAGRGIASNVVKLLLQELAPENLMASTEISANPSMVRILEKNGFIRLGNPWKSQIHDNFLALFLRFEVSLRNIIDL